MGIIPEIKLKELQTLDVSDLKNLESCTVTDSKGNYLATLIVPQTDFLKLQAEHTAEMSNGVKPKG